jgi:membrane fusion protein (multidrug efflux system)
METNLLTRKSPSSAPTAPPTRKRTRGAVIKVSLAVLVVFVLLAAIYASQIVKMVKMGAKMVPPPETVTSAEVRPAEWQPMLTSVGSIAPVQGATISAEVPGTVSEIAFKSGAEVKKGDILVRIDASAEEAQLRSAEADASLAKADLDRSRDLAQRKVISAAEFDAAESKFKQKVAAVDNIKSIIVKKNIAAPFDGRAGIREVNAGQMIPAGQSIVAVQTLDPVFADFAMPQQRVAGIEPGLEVSVTSDAFPGEQFKGKLTAVDSSVNLITRNVTLQATLSNPEHKLKPGMFARISVLLPQKKPVLVIPATAIAYAPYGNSVYVIEQKKDEKTSEEATTIRQQFVRTGETRGDFVEVTDGAKQGDQIVSTGLFKLRNGMAVHVDNKLAPKLQESPKPADS